MDKEIFDLALLARQNMLERGLQPDFSKEVLEQVEAIDGPAPMPEGSQDLRALLWCSIDNDDSLDLDQLTFAKDNPDGTSTLWVAVADVDALVKKNTPIDLHAQTNTTSVYTPAKIFTMLPEKLSTNLTSLNEKEDRIAMVAKMEMSPEGLVVKGDIFQAIVHNHAKLSYRIIGAWLEGLSDVPEKVKQVPGLEMSLKCQSNAAQLLKYQRHLDGALTLESPEPEAKIENDQIVLTLPLINKATQLIENFMIAANHVMALKLLECNIPSLRRVVRIPKYWDHIVQIAAEFGERLPEEPDSKALDDFLLKRKAADPKTFPDLSLTVIKLLGRGEYIVEKSGDKPTGHFGLAIRQYIHSTAPNRRYPDLISQRQYKACSKGDPNPYTLEELETLASYCTQQEDAATKVERQAKKSAGALLLYNKIGQSFDGIITGASDKGTWVRIFSPPIEGKLVQGFDGLGIGDRVKVKLMSVDVPKGFINFGRNT